MFKVGDKVTLTGENWGEFDLFGETVTVTSFTPGDEWEPDTASFTWQGKKYGIYETLTSDYSATKETKK